jgi:hypothetical protein
MFFKIPQAMFGQTSFLGLDKAGVESKPCSCGSAIEIVAMSPLISDGMWTAIFFPFSRGSIKLRVGDSAHSARESQCTVYLKKETSSLLNTHIFPSYF